MNSASFKKKRDGKFVLKYFGSDSYYKNGLLLECIQHYRHLMKGKLLDLGCGNKPYSAIYNEVCDNSTGCDVPFSLHKDAEVEVLCFAEDVDKHFDKNFFDFILCTEVIEHTVNDRKVFENINKILKIGGHLLISVPFTYVLHEAPHDYRRYTLYGLIKLLEDFDFKILSAHSAGASVSSGFYILYYTFTKIVYFILKKAGLKNIHENKFLRSITSLPELLFYFFSIGKFRKKLSENKFPSKNEMFSSMGYIITAKKVKNFSDDYSS